MTTSIGVIGARGHTGKELLSLVMKHSQFQLGAASSRTLVGQSVADYVGHPGTDVVFQNLRPNELPDMDAWVLALPNGYSHEYVTRLKIHQPGCVICDLSADHRFNEDWHYGLPELNRNQSRGKRHIANPGCYATAMQLAITPVRSLLDGPATCFGVSGYSGAGTTPSEKNDRNVLKDNLLPYCPTGHIHEKEVAQQLNATICFTPHVAEFFRGISMTVSMNLNQATETEEVSSRYQEYYGGEPMIKLSEEIPRVADNCNRYHASVGGWDLSEDKKHLVVFSTLDNLLKGAASQALQNLNNAFGFNETEGLLYV